MYYNTTSLYGKCAQTLNYVWTFLLLRLTSSKLNKGSHKNYIELQMTFVLISQFCLYKMRISYLCLEVAHKSILIHIAPATEKKTNQRESTSIV